MSESEEEFGGLAPTTPAAPIRKLARAAKPSSRAAPGPSSRPASGPPAKGTRKNAGPSPEADDSDVIAIDQDEELPALTRPTRSRAEPTATTNGRAVKGKGKAKVDPPRTTKKVLAASEPMDVDAIDVVDDLHEEHDVQDVARAINATFRDSRLPTTTARPSRGEGSSKEIERLRQRAIDAESQRDALVQQLEESIRIRQTEAEELLERQEMQHQAQVQAQEALIKELTSQLAQKEPLTRAGKTSVLHLLTREAADEEKRLLEKELRWWKDVSDEKQQMLTQKDKRITELEQIEKDLRFELKVEIENSKTLAAKAPRNPPPSATRARQGHGGVLGTDDPKHAEVVRFYEDLTNLLVTAMKLQPGKYLGLEEWCFTCIYTYVEDDNDSVPGVKKSLSFTLRFCYDPIEVEGEIPEVTSIDQLTSSVHYIPLDLDKEAPDYVEKLGFLGGPFTFSRDQLPLFLRTVYTNMGEATKEDEEDDGEDDEVQIMEL